MAKQLWFTDVPASAHRGNNDAKLNAATSWWLPLDLDEARGNTTGTTVTATCTAVTGPTSGIEVISGGLPVEWLTEPLAADFTIAGTITANLWSQESANAANAAINFAVDKVDGATGAVTRIATSARTTELGFSSPAAVNFTATPTSTACKRGDRLRVRVFADDAGTMGSGQTITLWFDRSTAAVQGDSWIQFTENLTFEPAGDPVNSLDQTQTNVGGIFGEASGGTSLPGLRAQPFVAITTNIVSATVWLNKNGLPTDNVVVEIQSDSSGSPSGTVIGTLGTVAGGTITTTMTQYVLTANVPVIQGNTYWIVFRRSGSLSSTDTYRTNRQTTAVGGWANYARSDNGTTWITETGALTVKISFAPSPYYLTTTAETITPGTASQERKASTTRGSGQSNIITNTATGPTAPILVGGATTIEWFTPPLEAVTLGGKAKFNIRGSESNASANASLKAEIAVTASDGSSPTVWGLANVEAATTNGSAGELPTTDGVMVAWVAGDDAAITAGQRLRFRIYVDDSGNAPLVTGSTVTVSYNGASASAAGDSYVILPVAVTEQVVAVIGPVRVRLVPSAAVIRAAVR